MGDTNKDLEDLAKTATEDFYDLLSVAFDADESTIKKAYRKASIRYHPDKNPDNKDAADRFIYLGWARDILLDPKLKGEYDRARTRRREKALQHDLMDSRRRKMKEDLERREQEGREAAQGVKRKRADDMSEASQRAQEIQRLQEDGRRRRMEAQERLEKKRKQEEEEASFVEAEAQQQQRAPQPGETPDLDRTVKVRFQRDGEAADWDKEKIASMFSKYGQIDTVVMAKDKKIRQSGEKHRKVTAMFFIIYLRLDHAHAAVSNAKMDIPLLDSVSWANGEPEIKSPFEAPANPPSAPTTPLSTPNKSFKASFGPGLGKGTPLSTPKFSFSPKTPSLQEITMIRLREAEKKRLEEQIRKQEAAEEAAADGS